MFQVFSPLGENLDFVSPLGFDIQRNSDHEPPKSSSTQSLETLSEWQKSDICSNNRNNF